MGTVTTNPPPPRSPASETHPAMGAASGSVARSALATLSTDPQNVVCSPNSQRGLNQDEASRRAALLKAVADPVRLQLLSVIRDSPGSEACVCDMTEAVPVSQPTVSHHLKVLTDAGLITRQRRGTWAWFSLVPDRFHELRNYFQ